MGAWNDHDTVTAPSLSASAESDMDLSMSVPTVDPKGTGPSDFLTASCIRRPAITGVMSEMCVSATARSLALQRGIACFVLVHVPMPAARHPRSTCSTVARVAEGRSVTSSSCRRSAPGGPVAEDDLALVSHIVTPDVLGRRARLVQLLGDDSSSHDGTRQASPT